MKPPQGGGSAQIEHCNDRVAESGDDLIRASLTAVYLTAAALWPVLRCARRRAESRASIKRMGGRAVECTGLEIRRSRKRSVGSNPTPSARNVRVRTGHIG